ncbi:hypothetical protein [Cryobacterium sp. N19]|nr:hypothetical protein [Cryobacterium sp. N19]
MPGRQYRNKDVPNHITEGNPMKPYEDVNFGRPRKRLLRTSVGAVMTVVLVAVLTACGGARTGAQLLDDVARALGRSPSEVSVLVKAQTTAAESSDDILRRWAAPLREPGALRDDALTVSCQTVIDLSTSDEPLDEKSLLILVNNIAGLDPTTASMLEVRELSDAAFKQLGGKSNALSIQVQLDRFKDAVCTG